MQEEGDRERWRDGLRSWSWWWFHCSGHCFECWQCQTANTLLQVCFCTLLLVRPDWILCVLRNLVELCAAHIVQALEGAPRGSSWKMGYFCVK